MKSGITVAGTLLVDRLNEISAYPASGELTKIHAVSRSVGGLVPNVGIDLKRICPDLTVKAAGLIGDDADGAFIKKTLADAGLDVSGLRECDERTSFTDVMSVTGGQRTFFTYAGACARFGADSIGEIDTKMLHLGYFLLLDRVDAGDGLAILKSAKEQGVYTSIDLVSENSDRYSLVRPCLEYVDLLVINEAEAAGLTGHTDLEKAARALRDMGVRERVLIHRKDVAVCLSDNGFTSMGSVDVPREYIKGTTGAGDAFCAGALVAAHRGDGDKEMLELATQTAVMALGSHDATSGIKTEAETRKFCARFPRM